MESASAPTRATSTWSAAWRRWPAEDPRRSLGREAELEACLKIIATSAASRAAAAGLLGRRDGPDPADAVDLPLRPRSTPTATGSPTSGTPAPTPWPRPRTCWRRPAGSAARLGDGGAAAAEASTTASPRAPSSRRPGGPTRARRRVDGAALVGGRRGRAGGAAAAGRRGRAGVPRLPQPLRHPHLQQLPRLRAGGRACSPTASAARRRWSPPGRRRRRCRWQTGWRAQAGAGQARLQPRPARRPDRARHPPGAARLAEGPAACPPTAISRRMSPGCRPRRRRPAEADPRSPRITAGIKH